MMRWRRTGVLFLILGISVQAFAGKKAASDSLRLVRNRQTFWMPAVVVTATKSPRKIEDLSVATSVIPAAEAKLRQVAQVTELLNDLPGVFAVQTGLLNNSSFRHLSGSSFTVRGTSVITMIDGRPVMMGIFDHPIPHSLNMGPWSRIEIIRGPASILYGSNATGGVVNLISAAPQPFSLSAGLTGGSFDTRMGNVTLSAKKGAVGGFVTYAANQSTGHRTDDNYLSHDFYAKFQARIAKQWQVTASAKRYRGKWNDPGPEATPFQNHWYDFIRRGGDLQVNYTAKKMAGNLQLYRSEGHHAIFDGWRSDDFTNGLKAFVRTTALPRNETVLGVDIRRFGGEQLVSHKKWQEQETAPYFLTQQEFSARWLLSAGFRLNHHSVYGNVSVPAIGLVYKLSPETRIRFNYGEGFKSPSIMQLYLFPPSNTRLKPERSRNLELGLRTGWQQKLWLDLSVYRLTGRDLIELYRASGTGRPKFRNVGRFTFRGLELSLRFAPVPKLFGTLSYTYQDVGEATAFRPAHKISLSVKYVQNRFRAEGRLHGVAGLYGENNHQQKLGNFLVADLFLLYGLTPQLDLQLAARNLLDAAYYYEPGYPMPPRNFQLGLHYRLSGVH